MTTILVLVCAIQTLHGESVVINNEPHISGHRELHGTSGMVYMHEYLCYFTAEDWFCVYVPSFPSVQQFVGSNSEAREGILHKRFEVKEEL